jgi:hypothetical protein
MNTEHTHHEETPEELDERLDEGLDETFPASDPVAVHHEEPVPPVEPVPKGRQV